MMKKRVHLVVSGLVQGVGFRYYVVKAAQRNGATGWVKNLHDGRVEAVAEGEEKQLQEFLAAVRKGPMFSQVKEVQVEWQESQDQFDGFRVTH